MIDLSSVDTMHFAWATASATLGGLLMGFTGFGSTLVMVPLIAVVWGPTEAIAIAMGISTVGTAQLVPEAVRDARWAEVWPACLGGLAGVPIGAWLLFTGDPEITRRIMGLVVIAVALILLRGWTYRGPRDTAVTAGFGAFGGFTTAYFGIGAPAVALYFLSGRERAAIQRANILLMLGVFSVCTLVAIAAGGGADLRTLVRGVVLYAPYALALWLGARLFRRASDATYRRAALWLLVVMGLTVSAL